MVAQNTFAFAWVGKHDNLKMNFKIGTTIDVNKCLKQNKLPDSVYICATLSELPWDIVFMVENRVN